MPDTRHDALWRRVEAHLDARTDPFHDASLARELRGAPEAEHAARRMMARLGALATVPLVHGASANSGSGRAANPVPRQQVQRQRVQRQRVQRQGAAPLRHRTRSSATRRVAALAACAAACAAFVALTRDDDEPRESAAVALVDARPELGVVYSAQLEVERSVPPPPRAALVIHETRHVVGWTLSGNER